MRDKAFAIRIRMVWVVNHARRSIVLANPSVATPAGSEPWGIAKMMRKITTNRSADTNRWYGLLQARTWY